VAGLARFGPGSAYDDAFNRVTLASQMTCDFRILAEFASGALSHVVLDHNFNDKRGLAGVAVHPSSAITSVTKGVQTVFGVATQRWAVGDPIMVRVTGIPKLDYLARRVQAVTANTVTVNWDSTSFVGTLTAGTAYRPDRDTINGGWDFVIYTIRWAANLYERPQPLIILCNSPAEYLNGQFEETVYSSGQIIAAVADKWDLPYFDVADAYEVDQGSFLTYFPDGTHPSDLATREVLAALWENWLAGGHFTTVNPDTNVDLSQAIQDASDQFAVGFDQFNGKHRALTSATPVGTNKLTENFTNTLAGYSIFGAVPPVIVAAPWGVGQALRCAAASGADSYLTIPLDIGQSLDFTFDLYLAALPSLGANPTTQVVRAWQFNTVTDPALLLQLILTNTGDDGELVPTKAQMRASWYPFPGDLRALNTSVHPTLITAGVKHTIRMQTRRATADTAGGIKVSVNGVPGISATRVFDSDHTALTTAVFGIRAHSVTAGVTLHLGNISINGASAIPAFSGRLLPGQDPVFINGVAYDVTVPPDVPPTRLALGAMNVFDADGVQRTFSQAGDFGAGRRSFGGDILAESPDDVFPSARVRAQTVNYATGLGYALEPGTSAFAVLVTGDGQSPFIGATGGESALPPTRQYNLLPPLPRKYVCFNNGPFPLDANTGGPEALETALDLSDIATVVDCADYINPQVQRDTPLLSAGLVIADALRGTSHKVFAFAFAIGSTSFNDRLYGFKGSRAAGTVSISGTTATITVASGSLNAKNLILIGSGIAANTFITTDPAPLGTGTFSVQVSPSQTVGPVAFTTQDQRQRQYKNFILALDAFAAWARANNLTPIMPHFFFIGGEAESNAPLVATGRNLFANLREVVNEFANRLQ
ncbi:MAG: hypothetical protein ACRC14_01085, partial [Paracoccaceae bacterium]